HLETGLVGLTAWLLFILWVFTRERAHRGDPWMIGVRLAWYCCLAFLSIGLIGIGLTTAIPSSAVMLMAIGWVANYQGRLTKRAGVSLPSSQVDPRMFWNYRQVGMTRR